MNLSSRITRVISTQNPYECMKEIVDCRLCPRLVDYLKLTKSEFPGYHCRPVPAFGDVDASLLIVGLAPGKHGANATGIPFTGDAAGVLLYQTLYDFGFADQPKSSSDGSILLINCRITNAVKCLPPQNRPAADEINRCNTHLTQELSALKPQTIVMSLGQIAHKAVIKSLGLRQRDFPFAHAAEHRLNGNLMLIDSYHCSRYNTQTGRLTEDMFRQVFRRIKLRLNEFS